MIRPLASAVCLVLLGSVASAADLARDYLSAALQGDLSEVGPRLLASGPTDAAETKLRGRYVARFERGEGEALPAGVTPLQADLIRAYRGYWNEALRAGWDTDAGRPRIEAAVRDVLERHDVPFKSDDVLGAMKRGVEAEGAHVQGGITRPHFDLLMWRSQEDRPYEVELTDGVQSVDVAFIGDFLSYGWSHWATFGRAYPGGWAEPDRLVCLAEDYDLESEKFRVSYLKHEARHFADYEIYPELRQTDLEYRGKLTELIYAQTSLDSVLDHFARAGEFNAQSPHAWANRCVIRDLSEELFGEDVPDREDGRWSEAGRESVAAAARRLLDRHDERLREAGAATVRAVIGPEAAGSP